MTSLVHSGEDAVVPTAQAAPVSAEAMKLLSELAPIVGADVWERWDAGLCRELEKHRLVRIVKARHAPKNGAARQPYFGVKATAAGRAAIAKATGEAS